MWVEDSVVAGGAAKVGAAVDGSAGVVCHVRQVGRRIHMVRQGEALEVHVLEPLRHVPEGMGLMNHNNLTSKPLKNGVEMTQNVSKDREIHLVEADKQRPGLAAVAVYGSHRPDRGVCEPQVRAILVRQIFAARVKHLRPDLFARI